jgi:hypothetical protein
VVPCNHFYVHFSEHRDGTFYNFSVVALPLSAAGCIRISSVESLLDFMSLFESDSMGQEHSNVLWDSAMSILRVQAQWMASAFHQQ